MLGRERLKWILVTAFIIILLSVTLAWLLGGFQKLYNYVLMTLDIEPKYLILNDEEGRSDDPGPQNKLDGSSLSRDLQKSFLRLKGRYLSEDGKSVDYVGLRNSSEFAELEKESRKFKYITLDDMNDTERKALYINLYNIITIHGLTKSESVKSVLELVLFWRRMAYNIGGHTISLDMLEHGLIRGNRPHPTTKKELLAEDSELLKYALKTLDPRIHFALNCGAKSCPAIRVYSGENVDAALESAAIAFCSNEVEIDETSKTATISQIFEWYGSDFGSTNREILEKISKYLPEEKKQKMVNIISADAKIQFKKYDWGLNSA